jgi:holliday junction DNA helicase RuvA
MIEMLKGKVSLRLPHMAIIDVQGVGYGVEMPLSTLCELPHEGAEVKLFIETHVREDAIRLFGFLTFEDRQMFSLIRSVSGIGPKTGLALLSSMDARQLRQVILSGKVGSLESVPGIGRRTAEKLIVELKGKVEKFSFVSVGPELLGQSQKGGKKTTAQELEFDEFAASRSGGIDTHFDDLRSALDNLGYKDRDIGAVMEDIRKHFTDDEPVGFQQVLKVALQALRSHSL